MNLRNTIKNCFIHKFTLSDIIFSILLAFSANIFLRYINYPIIKLFAIGSNGSVNNVEDSFIFGNIFFLCIIPAIIEEIIFRGIFLKKLLYKFSPIKAMMFSSIVYAILHFDVNSMLPQFLLGIILCLISFSTNSVVTAMISHFCYNFIIVTFEIQVLQYVSNNMIITFLISLLTLLVGVMYFRNKILRREIQISRRGRGGELYLESQDK